MSESKTIFKIFFLLLSFVWLASCSNKSVTVVNRGKSFYGKNNNHNKEKYLDSGKKTNSENQSRSRQIEVKDDENIYSISKKYQVPLRDLIEQNNLSAPYKLSRGTKLSIPAPSYHEVAAKDTVYSIARTYKMNINSLIEMNDLKQPYKLEVGQKIRIAKFKNDDSSKQNLVPAYTKKDEESSEKTENKSSSPSFIERTLDKINHFAWPLHGQIISKFGPKSGGLYNDGINIKAAEGDEVKAVEDGVVSYAGNELKGYGNLIIIKHSGGWITAYAHLSKISVKRGQKVVKLNKIGEVGSTGNVTSAQLYFGLRKGRDAVNPENYLSK